MAMIVRNPTPGEVAAAADVAYAAFQNQTPERWRKSFQDVAEMFGERFILVGELNGKIVSSLVCCPSPIVIDGAEVTHASVGSVGTLPEYRKKGCAGALMSECVKLLRNEGIYTSSLWPFSYAYYRKFGWEVGAEVRKYRGKGSLFAGAGDASKARAATPGDYGAVAGVYAVHMSQNNCSTVRSPEWWEKVARLPLDLKMTTEPGRGAVVCYSDDGRFAGYLVYDIYEGDPEHGASRGIEVKEIVAWEPEHRRSMLALLGSIDPEMEIAFNAPADDLFLHEIPDPRAISTSVEPSFQFRVIDPECAIASLEPHQHVKCSFTLSLSDPVFRHGFEFGVEVANGKVAIRKPGPSNRIEMSVQTLAKLLTGYLNMFDASHLGLVRGKQITLLEAGEAFPTLAPYRSWLEPG